jgi:GNAT superfamily N-acetyltransferase
MDFLIDDDASLEEVDLFLDEVFREKNIANLAGWIQMNLQSKYFHHFFEAINKRIGHEFGEDIKKWDHNILIAPSVKPKEKAVPQGYTLGPLLESHVDLITAQWALDTGITVEEGSADSSLSYTVMTNITQRPSFGIFTDREPEKPIAWISVYPGGCVGMLHVVESHQRRGLARILVRHTLKVIQETHGMTYRPHTCAKKVNTPSLNLFLSEGWELQPYNNKKMIFRSSTK